MTTFLKVYILLMNCSESDNADGILSVPHAVLDGGRTDFHHARSIVIFILLFCSRTQGEDGEGERRWEMELRISLCSAAGATGHMFTSD